MSVDQPPPTTEKQGSEFDEYADDYTGGSEVALKRMLGRDLSDYVEVKAEWLLRDLSGAAGADRADPAGERPASDTTRLLDYGCGNGVLLMLLRRLGFRGDLAGADVSAGMLEEAARQWPDDSPPGFRQINKGSAPYDDGSFDIVVASAVFHHVPPADRAAVYGDMARLLAPGGRAYVFEHNPLNPLTRYVVRRTPIDRNAILLGAGEVVSGLASAGLQDVRTKYLMFFPPAARLLRPAERALGWLPIGAQYVVRGRLAGSG